LLNGLTIYEELNQASLSNLLDFGTLLSENRKKFDQGVDPLDPEQQKQGGQGFNPFRGGGGRGFKFHFGGGGGNFHFRGNPFHDEF